MDLLKVYSPGDYQLNSKIKLHHPILQEIADYGEKEYFSLIRTICATPADQKVAIWDTLHIYWDQVDEYELFLSMFQLLKDRDCKIIFPDLDLTKFQLVLNPTTKDMALSDGECLIDRSIHFLLTQYLRTVHAIEKNVDVGYDEYTKDIMIEDDRDEAMIAARKGYTSNLWPLISALTNSPEFKYRYDDVWTLPIGVFMDALKRVQKQKNYEHLMHGVYAGTIDTSKISKKEFNWIGKLD